MSRGFGLGLARRGERERQWIQRHSYQMMSAWRPGSQGVIRERTSLTSIIHKRSQFERICLEVRMHLFQPPSLLCLPLYLTCGLMYCSPVPHRPGESSVRAGLVSESMKHPTRCEREGRVSERVEMRNEITWVCNPSCNAFVGHGPSSSLLVTGPQLNMAISRSILVASGLKP